MKMELFHGSHSNTAPVITVESNAMASMWNTFDGIFASDEYGVAASHGNNAVYTYIVEDEKIATSSDLDAKFKEVYSFLRNELYLDDDYDVSEIADRIMWDNDRDIEDFSKILNPRSDTDWGGLSLELQRLRGRVAAHLGFDAVEMEDEHGTSYLIVNPSITAE